MTALKVNELSENAKCMVDDYALVTALLGGTVEMRKAGTAYMQKFRLEDPEDYRERVNGATLFPAYSETCKKMTARAFAEPMVVNDDVPPWIVDEVLDNVDRKGRNIHVFAREVFAKHMEYGMTFVIVDAPPTVDGTGTRVIKTRADQKKAGIRPYWLHYSPTQYLGHLMNGTKLTQIRFSTCREASDGGPFGTVDVPQVVVYQINEAGTMDVQTWEEVAGKRREKEYVLVSTVNTELTEIPLIVFYSNRCGDMCAKPVLMELAHLNVKHWNKQSTNDQLVAVASVPILVCKGGDAKKTIVIGARNAIHIPQEADLKFVEHTGKAIEAGQHAIDKLEEQMRAAGAKLLHPGSGIGRQGAQGAAPAKTATQSSEEASADNSILGAICQDFEDSMAQVLSVTASYRDKAPQPKGGTVELQANLDPDLDPVGAMTVLQKMADSGKLSDETFFSEAQKRGFVGDEIEWEEEQARIKKQGDNLMQPPARGSRTPGQPPVPGQPPAPKPPTV